jgi:hypothetical protein
VGRDRQPSVARAGGGSEPRRPSPWWPPPVPGGTTAAARAVPGGAAAQPDPGGGQPQQLQGAPAPGRGPAASLVHRRRRCRAHVPARPAARAVRRPEGPPDRARRVPRHRGRPVRQPAAAPGGGHRPLRPGHGRARDQGPPRPRRRLRLQLPHLRHLPPAGQGWSDANPDHVPIAVLVELKDERLELGDFPFVVPEKWTAAGMDSLDAEIRSVFSPADLITPDDVRGSHATLDEAVTTDGWPTLESSRGKVMFLMDNGGGYRTDYLAGHPSLAGRVLFTNAVARRARRRVREDERLQRRGAHRPAGGRRLRGAHPGRLRHQRGPHQRHHHPRRRPAQRCPVGEHRLPRAGLAVEFTSRLLREIPGGTVARCNPVNAPPACSWCRWWPGWCSVSSCTGATTPTACSSTCSTGSSPLFTVAIIYSYRAQLKPHLYLLYGVRRAVPGRPGPAGHLAEPGLNGAPVQRDQRLTTGMVVVLVMPSMACTCPTTRRPSSSMEAASTRTTTS